MVLRKSPVTEMESSEGDENIIIDEVKKVKKEKKNVSDKYYAIPEDELQAIILRAQTGSQRDQAELLKVFNNFITKYVSLLYRSKFDLHDYDLRRFISLFVVDKTVRFNLRREKLNNVTYKGANETMRGINYMIKRYGDEDDVRQTVQMTFLQCMMRYKRKGSIPFSGYLYSYFFYLLKKNVDNFLIYQLGRKSFPLHTDDSVSSSFFDPETEQAPPHVQTMTPSVEDLLGTEEIDEYWVLGEVALFPFDGLTIQQRQLLKWKFVDGLKASQIALKTTEHPNTCRAQIQDIRNEIRDIIESEFTI
jgi:hypothetical protein